jgi:hypothetical protein
MPAIVVHNLLDGDWGNVDLALINDEFEISTAPLIITFSGDANLSSVIQRF